MDVFLVLAISTWLLQLECPVSDGKVVGAAVMPHGMLSTCLEGIYLCQNN